MMVSGRRQAEGLHQKTGKGCWQSSWAANTCCDPLLPIHGYAPRYAQLPRLRATAEASAVLSGKQCQPPNFPPGASCAAVAGAPRVALQAADAHEPPGRAHAGHLGASVPTTAGDESRHRVGRSRRNKQEEEPAACSRRHNNAACRRHHHDAPPPPPLVVGGCCCSMLPAGCHGARRRATTPLLPVIISIDVTGQNAFTASQAALSPLVDTGTKGGAHDLLLIGQCAPLVARSAAHTTHQYGLYREPSSCGA